MLKLIMAVSHDGYVARGPDDNMDWTGPVDKQVFRMLTGVGGVVGVGSRTLACMPTRLAGRKLVCISDNLFGFPEQVIRMHLGQFAHRHPDAWLAGGQTVAMAALQAHFVDEVHLIRNPAELGEGIADEITPHLRIGGWELSMSTKLNWGSITVEVWRVR